MINTCQNGSTRKLWLPASLLLFLLLLIHPVSSQQQQQQDPRTINGGSILAMAGKECVAVAVDKRFGSGPQMVNISPRHIWTPQPNLMVAFCGLDGDVQTLIQMLQREVSAKLNRALGFEVVSREEEEEEEGYDNNNNDDDEDDSAAYSVSRLRRLSPQSLATLTSHVLYSNRGRLFTMPLIVGIKDRSRIPFLCGMDSIGAQSLSKSFVCSGAASKSLYGTAEALWQPNLEPDELAETCGKAFQSALERDCFSGYGAIVYVISKDGIVEYDLASRID